MRTRRARLLVPLLLVTGLLVSAPIGTAQSAPDAAPSGAAAAGATPRFTGAAGFDVSPPMREAAPLAASRAGAGAADRAERGALPADRGFRGDRAVQSSAAARAAAAPRPRATGDRCDGAGVGRQAGQARSCRWQAPSAGGTP